MPDPMIATSVLRTSGGSTTTCERTAAADRAIRRLLWAEHFVLECAWTRNLLGRNAHTRQEHRSWPGRRARPGRDGTERRRVCRVAARAGHPRRLREPEFGPVVAAGAVPVGRLVYPSDLRARRVDDREEVG